MSFLHQGTMPETPKATAPGPISHFAHSSIFSKRSLRQLGLFFGGAAFFGVASAITRRALVRRYKATIPKFYQPSNRPNGEVNGAIEAFEALSVATINVLSISMMLTGGSLWAFDIASLDDMKQKIRGGLGIDGEGRDKAADEEMEEWLATVLARKEEKAKQRNASEGDKER